MPFEAPWLCRVCKLRLFTITTCSSSPGIRGYRRPPQTEILKTALASCSNVIIFKVGGPNLTLSLKLLLSSVPLPEFLSLLLWLLSLGWIRMGNSGPQGVQCPAALSSTPNQALQKKMTEVFRFMSKSQVGVFDSLCYSHHTCGHKYRPQNSAGPWGPELSTIRLCCPRCWRCDVLGIPVMLFGLGGHSVGATGAFGNHLPPWLCIEVTLCDLSL